MGCWWRIYLKLSLTSDFVDGSLICELSHKLVSLNVDILFAWRCLRCLDIASEKLLCSFRSLLLEAFRVIFALVCLEELVWICASGDNHGSIRAPTENTFIIHDILRVVLIGVRATVRVLILLFLSDYARVCRETLPASSATRLLQHFLNFI